MSLTKSTSSLTFFMGSPAMLFTTFMGISISRFTIHYWDIAASPFHVNSLQCAIFGLAPFSPRLILPYLTLQTTSSLFHTSTEHFFKPTRQWWEQPKRKVVQSRTHTLITIRASFQISQIFLCPRGLVISRDNDSLYRQGDKLITIIPYWRYWSLKKEISKFQGTIL